MCVPASLSALAGAAVFGWLAPVLPRLLSPGSEIPMTSEEASWLVTLPDFGNLLSPIPASILADRFGRKTIIMSSGPVFLAGWAIVQYFDTLLAVSIARVIQGIGIGIIFTVLPMYLGEIAAPEFRGMVVSTFFTAWWFGFLFEYLLGPILSFTNFTYVTSFTNVIFIMAFTWQPESPYYYLLKNDIDKAEKSLSWFFCKSEEEISKELVRMKLCMEQDKVNKVKWSDLIVNSTIRKNMMISILIGFIRMCCGLWPLSTFSTQTLIEEGDNFLLSPDEVTIAMGIMMLFGSFGGFFTIDLFRRTSLLFLSCFTSGLCMFSVGSFYFLKHNSSIDVSLFNWVPTVGLILFSATSVLGIFPVFTAYQSELFDTKTRSTASSVMAIYTTIAGFPLLKLYLTIANCVGVYLNFYIFSVVCFFGAVLSCTIMPETKGISLD